MRAMRTLSLAVVVMAVLAAACSPLVSVNPLSSPAEPDKRLEGLWRYESKEGDRVFLHVGEKDLNRMEAVSIEHRDDGTLNVIRAPFFITKTAGNEYLNLRLEEVDEEGAENKYQGFLFLKYTVDDDSLMVFPLTKEPIIAAIQANALKGEVVYDDKGGDARSAPTIDHVTITDDSANILQFLETGNHAELFPEAMRFVRMK